ncbi:MAG: phosphatidate cytidylyltransferase [Verrucomicrobiota bacterium]
MFRARLITTLVSIALVLGLVYARVSILAFLLVAVIGLLAQWEFYCLQESKGLDVYKKFGVVMGGIYFSLFYLKLIRGDDQMLWETIETISIVLVPLALLIRSVFESSPKTPVATVALTFFGFFYVPYCFNFVSKIIYIGAATPAAGVVMALYVVAVTKSTDIGAYLTGSWIGKHPMSPGISPKKTWEGFSGGILFGLGISLVMVACFKESLAELRWGHAIALGVLLPLISVIGDLAESRIKRDAESKDSGGMLPGIGGGLDLIDSLLFTAPVFYLYLTWIQLS